MIKSPFGFRIFPSSILALGLAAFCFAASASAGTVEFFTDFSAGSKPAATYRNNDAKSSLAPYFPNFMYWESGGDSNLRYTADDADGYIVLAVGKNQTASFQITASSMMPGATCFDLTSGDLVYEAYYAVGWTGSNSGSYHHGISINGNTMRLLYHPGYSSGAFRIEGAFNTCSNQNTGFVPPVGANDYTKMKVTIHRNEDAGNYEFKIQMGLASNPVTEESDGYTFTYTHNCPIATIDAAGGIQSIGPYGYNNTNNNVTNLYLSAPFADKATDLNNVINEKRDYFITEDKPVHLYKLGDSSSTTVTDYGSNPQDGTAANVNMGVVSNLNQVAAFSGSSSQITVAGAETINGPWTAEFLLNPSDMSTWQALMSGGSYSLRWSQYGALGKPGFTVSRVKDYVFTDLDGNPFSTDISLNEWHHVAYVNDGSQMLFYLDGELVGKNTETTIPLAYDTIGTVGGGYFKGMIDYIALYDYALSPHQIWEHANPVPEPATWAMLLLGAAGLLCLRKRGPVAVRS